MIKVIITGPECSGKTTLCDNLSKHFNAKKVDEYAREFLNESNDNYKYHDLITIAKNQYKNEKNNYTGKVMFCDTDLITIKIWSDYKYQKCDDWITQKINSQKKERRIYILCKPDLPWEYDPQRENKNSREELFNNYKKELIKNQHEFFVIQGKNRFNNTLNYLKNII